MSQTEETRAVLYRAQLNARNANTRRREQQLVGDASAAKQVRDGWAAWTDPQPTVPEPYESDRVN